MSNLFTPLISRFIHIRNECIWLDGKLVYQHTNKESEFLKEAYLNLGISYPKFYKMDMLSKLGFLAAEYLLKGVDLSNIPSFRKGIVLHNTTSSLQTDRKFQESIQTIASPALFVYTLPNIVLGEIAIRNSFKGENTFFVTEKSDATLLYDYTNILFEQNIITKGIAGFVECNEENTDVFFCLIEEEGTLTFDVQTLEKLYTKNFIAIA